MQTAIDDGEEWVHLVLDNRCEVVVGPHTQQYGEGTEDGDQPPDAHLPLENQTDPF